MAIIRELQSETGSYLTAHTTIQSFQTADLSAGSKGAVSVGIFVGIIPRFRSLVTLAVSQADFSLPSLHPKIPFPAAGFQRPIPFGSREYWESSSLLVEAVEALTIVLAVATIRGSPRVLLEILPCVLVPRRARGLWSN